MWLPFHFSLPLWLAFIHADRRQNSHLCLTIGKLHVEVGTATRQTEPIHFIIKPLSQPLTINLNICLKDLQFYILLNHHEFGVFSYWSLVDTTLYLSSVKSTSLCLSIRNKQLFYITKINLAPLQQVQTIHHLMNFFLHYTSLISSLLYHFPKHQYYNNLFLRKNGERGDREEKERKVGKVICNYNLHCSIFSSLTPGFRF